MRDIFDTVRDVSTFSNDTVDSTFKQKKYSSIAKRSTEGTLQFPTIISKAIDIETAQMVSKALERQFVSFTQIALSMNPLLDLSKDKDAIGYLRKFHQNSNVKADFRDVMNMGADILKDNYSLMTNDSETAFMMSAVYEGSTIKVEQDNKKQLTDLFENINVSVLNDKFTPNKGIQNFGNRGLNEHYNAVTEAKRPRRATDYSLNKNHGKVDDELDYDNKVLRNAIAANNIIDAKAEHEYKKLRNDKLKQDLAGDPSEKEFKGLRNDEMRARIRKTDDDIRRNNLVKIDLPNEMLKNNDVRKANELIPTTMHVRTVLINGEKETQGTMDFIIGIKSTLHPVSSEEVVSNIVSAVKTRGKIFNFIRWTTGETSFLKDFVFNVNEMKNDVANRSAGSSHWWIALKRRRALSKLKNIAMFKNQLLPNASIVVSMDEVNYIKSEFGYDLMDSKFVSKVMDQYFLLSFVVVDTASQVTHFLFDGSNDFQSVSFSGLEREGKGIGGGNDLKDVLKLVQRV